MKRAVKFHRELLATQQAVNRIKDGIKALIQALPGPSEKSGIKQFGKAAIVNTSALIGGFNICATTYNFPLQYQALCEAIDKARPEMVMRVLASAIENKMVSDYSVSESGEITWRAGVRGKITLHPEVIANLKGLMA